MAQEANGLPYQSGNQSGVGAVYFDKTIEPLALHLQNLKELDGGDDFWKMQKLKQAEDAQKAKLAEDIVKDLAVNPNGAMSEDIENIIKPSIASVTEKYKNIVAKYGGDMAKISRSPEYQALRGELNDIKGTIYSSSDNSKNILKWASEYDPAKYDPQSLANIGELRSAASPADRNAKLQAMGGSPLVEIKPQFFQELGARREKGLYKPSEREVSVFDNKSQRYGTQKVTEYTPQDLDRNSQAIFFGEPKMVRAATQDFNLLANKSPALRDQIVLDAQKAGVDPIQQFIRKQLEDSQAVKSDYANLAWSPWQQQDAQNKSEEGFVNYVIEQGGNLLNGNEEIYNIGGGSVDEKAQITPGISVSVKGNKPVYSDKLQGMVGGAFSYPTVDANGNNIMTSSPNVVLSFKYIDGKPYIKTTETVYKKNSGSDEYAPNVPIDDEFFKPATSADIEKIIAANSKDPSTAIEKYRTSLIRQKAYPEKVAKPEMTVGGKSVGNQPSAKLSVSQATPTVEKKAEVKPAKITTAEFNAKWASLKSGEKLVGPDGVTYTKK